jgi:hypothetical protein
MDGRRIGVAHHLNEPNQWIDVGPVPLAPAGTHRIELRRPTRSLAPGDAQPDHIGPIVVRQGAEPELLESLPGDDAYLCNRRLDWIDVLPPG